MVHLLVHFLANNFWWTICSGGLRLILAATYFHCDIRPYFCRGTDARAHYYTLFSSEICILFLTKRKGTSCEQQHDISSTLNNFEPVT